MDPIWSPSPERIQRSQLTRFMKLARERYRAPIPDYAALHRWSVEFPESFWSALWDLCLSRREGGRAARLLNPRGVRIGTAEIYRQVEKVPEVAEAVAIAQDWQADVRIVLFVKLRDAQTLDEPLKERIRRTIRNNTTPRHVPAKILQAPDLPRTVNGKLVELAVRNVVHGRSVKNRDALANPESLEYFSSLPELQE